MSLTIAIDARLVSGTSTGDSTYWSGLLHGFSKLEGDWNILLYSNAAKPQEIPDDPRMRWIELHARSSRWWSIVAFPLAARKAGADVIHTQYNLSPLAGSLGVTTIHDVSFLLNPEWFKPKDRYLLSRFVPAAARRAGRVITVSETSREEIERLIPAAKGKVSVTPNAAAPWLHSVQDAKEIVRREFGIEEPFLLTVGTRWPRKNAQLAIDAVALLPGALPHRLVLTGKAGWGSEELNVRTTAVGYVSNEQLCALYSAADLYLIPSKHEGFGITMLEAFTCGCPVLSSAGGALPEVAGQAAETCHSWEPAVWAEHIQRLLGDSSKLEKLRRKGHERAREFTWEKTAKLTLEVYRQVAAKTK